MSNDYTTKRVFALADTLETGEYLFKTEYGSLVTETMLKAQLTQQFEQARRRLDAHVGLIRLCITMKVSD